MDISVFPVSKDELSVVVQAVQTNPLESVMRTIIVLVVLYFVIRNREAIGNLLRSKGVKTKLKWAGHSLGLNKRPPAA